MTAEPLSLIVGTAGHIDHGKSALVEALTGTHPDRLAEERRRGITIDLGFAHAELTTPAGRLLRLGFIDVPGHERFVRNMLAGAGGIDLVLLVVAADEGVKPQTREHFEICRLLGIPRGIVAITKADMADAEMIALVRAEVAELTRGSFLAAAPFLPVSAKTGAGLEALRRELAAAGETAARRNAAAPARLPIDRVFTMRGFGTVVTGTLLTGQIAVESELERVAPEGGGRRLRVRAVQVHGQPVARAAAGQRTAINLAGIEPAALARGMVLAEPGVFRAIDRLDVALELLPSAPPLKPRTPVHVHALSAETTASVTLLGRSRLAPGETAFAHLRLAAPLPLIPGDRFIVRQFSPLATIGGGRVLDAAPPERGLRSAARAAMLERLAAAGDPERLAIVIERAGPLGVSPRELALAEGRRSAEVADALVRLQAAGRLVLAGQQALAPAAARDWETAILTALAAFNQAEPLAPGIGAEALRGRMQPPRLRRPEFAPLFRALLQRLVAAGRVEVAGELLRLPGRGPRLGSGEREARERIETAFRQAGLRAPAVAEVLAQSRVEEHSAAQLLQLLLRDGSLVKVSDELILHREALAALRQRLAEQKARAPRLSVPEFKALTGITRKYAIPLLEYLDRARVTRRVGDQREIL